MAEQATPPVDETPMSPLERKDSLEKHLQQRPEAQDLKNRNILLDTTAAPYVSLVGLFCLLTRALYVLGHVKSWTWTGLGLTWFDSIELG